jgi:Xrn1 SH3-like domain
VRFKHGDKVRLTRDADGVPKGTKGTVMGYHNNTAKYDVTFLGYGVHSVTDDALEAADDE